jgi:serine/threonine protein kinase
VERSSGSGSEDDRSATPEEPWTPGTVVGGRYRVEARLARGGMGSIHVARHIHLDRPVALKRLHAAALADAQALIRFEREARAAAKVLHEHVVDILDLGFEADGAPYIAMELLEGRSLADLLALEGPLEPERACRILGQVLSAVIAIHERGIVHRDLKPDNIFLCRRVTEAEFVKVLDFGVAKLPAVQHDFFQTRDDVLLGTPYYMSPEQARGDVVLDHRIDLFALGVVLYECLTGRLPYDGDNYHRLLQRILEGRHRPVRELAPEVSPALEEVVELALASDPAERFPDAATFLDALAEHGAGARSPSHRLSQPPARRPTLPGALRASVPLPRRHTEGDRRATPRVTSPWASPRSGVVPTHAVTLVRGALAKLAWGAVAERVPEDFLEGLSPSVRDVFESPVLGVESVPLRALAELLKGAERRAGRGEGTLCVEVGRAMAEVDLPRVQPNSMSAPEEAGRRLVTTLRQLHEGVDARAERTASGSLRIDLLHLRPDSLHYLIALAGLCETLVRAGGASDARAMVVKSRERGDDASAIVLRFK